MHYLQFYAMHVIILTLLQVPHRQFLLHAPFAWCPFLLVLSIIPYWFTFEAYLTSLNNCLSDNKISLTDTKCHALCLFKVLQTLVRCCQWRSSSLRMQEHWIDSYINQHITTHCPGAIKNSVTSYFEAIFLNYSEWQLDWTLQVKRSYYEYHSLHVLNYLHCCALCIQPAQDKWHTCVTGQV